MDAPLKLLWIPKNFREFTQSPERAYSGSNRMRAVNFHDRLVSFPDFSSDVAGLSVAGNWLMSYDIVVFQKKIVHPLQTAILKRRYDKLVVFDACDPVGESFVRWLDRMVDLVICSSHELEDDMHAKGLCTQTEVVVDSHEVDEAFVKQHSSIERPVVTWYGAPHNYHVFVKPMLETLNSEAFDFRWASSDEPDFLTHYGYERGVIWNIPMRDAWREVRSWQYFIQKSDIGINPIGDTIKSAHKTLNYMAYGIPVVCSPTDAHKRIVKHGVNGFFAESASDWIKYIRILADPLIRQEFGRSARDSVLKEYSLSALSERYGKVLQNRFRG